MTNNTQKLRFHSIYLLIALCLMPILTVYTQSEAKPAVKAVLFYSPSCGHCHHVITEVLVPMLEEHGDQLQIAGIDVSQASGAQLYQVAIEEYEIPPERRGVPALIVGDAVLVGSVEIPEQFPALFEAGLAAGGIDWPALTGLAPILSQGEEESTPATESTNTAPPVTPSATAPSMSSTPIPAVTSALASATPLPPTASPVPPATRTPASSVLTVGEDDIPLDQIEEPPADPVGFAIAGVILAGMVIAFGYATWRIAKVKEGLFQFSPNPVRRVQSGLVPLLALLGMGVAAYLAYVEVNQVEAVCGPVGECNIVQTSAYAVMLGLPVAVWGVINYLAIGILWTGQRSLSGRPAHLLAIALLGLTLFGTLFSIYLTYLELFAIHAICAWCLSSAIITALLMLLVTHALTRRRHHTSYASDTPAGEQTSRSAEQENISLS